MSDYFGKETPKLGFGLMRLPRVTVRIDVKQTSAMVDKFLEAGFTYFDTAFVYVGQKGPGGPPSPGELHPGLQAERDGGPHGEGRQKAV